MKRNVTITLDEKTAHWARVEAARRDTGVSEFVRSLLAERMTEEGDYERVLSSYLETKPVVLKRTGRYPTRSALHQQ